MKSQTIRAWYLVHKWTSLICTGFLLLLCLTGLPLIFHEEIDDALGEHGALESVANPDARVSLDTILANALKSQPGEVPLFMSFDDERPIVYVTSAPAPDSNPDKMHFMVLDERTGQIMAQPKGDGVMDIIFRLHTDLFAGLPGLLFMGVMGLLFFASIVSGVVVYAPFMRKLDFGTVRTTRSTRLKWLDYHNLLGIVTVVWVSVVGLTGVINTIATPIIQFWQANELTQMTAAYKNAPPIRGAVASLDNAMRTARDAAPGKRVQFIAFPGTSFTSKHHYGLFLQGTTPLTKHMLTPALIDAQSGVLTDMRSLPWYAQTLLISQPLHFGDYGGLPLKILWALLDIVAIVVLGSGLYLWLGKRRAPVDARLAELQSGGAPIRSAAE